MADTPFAAACARVAWPGDALRPLPPVAQIGFQLVPEADDDAARSLGLSALPAPKSFAAAGGVEVIWLGPMEYLVVSEDGRGPEIEQRLREAIGETRGAVVDLSASRVGFQLSGPSAREVLSTCAAIDLHPRVFRLGSAAATLVASVPVVLYQVDDGPSYRILVRPSFASFLVDWLVDGMASIKSQ